MTQHAHDFKAVLEDLTWCAEQIDDDRLTRLALSTKDRMNTIRFALRLADKVMQPSGEMVKVGFLADFMCEDADEIFKEMISQAIKEIEG